MYSFIIIIFKFNTYLIKKQPHYFTAHATSLYGLAMVTIDVIDTNDHPPVFSQMSYSASLAENLPAGHCFLQVCIKFDCKSLLD